MIDASVRLWNPAFVAPAAAFALASAMEGRRRGDPRWWVAVGIGLVLAGQSHVLAWALVAPIGVLAIDELRRTGRRAVPWLTAAAAIVALSFLPLLVHELTSEFSELHGAHGRERRSRRGPPIWIRLVFVPMRILAVPLVGDVLRSILVTTAAAATVVGAAILATSGSRSGRRSSRQSRGGRAPAGRRPGRRPAWIGPGAGCLILAVGAPWLSTVTPLYVDHYHLVLDPLVFALLGLGAAVLWRRAAGRAATAAIVVAIVAWNLVVVPLPPVNADGGWPAGLTAGQRVVTETGEDPDSGRGRSRVQEDRRGRLPA